MRSPSTTPRAALVYPSPPPVYKAGRAAPAWFAPRGRASAARSRAEDARWPSGDHARSFACDPRCVGRPEPPCVAAGRIPAGAQPRGVLSARAARCGRCARSCPACRRWSRDATMCACRRFRLAGVRSIGHTFNRMADALEESHAETTIGAGTKQSSDASHDPRPAGQHLVLEPGRGAIVRISCG